MCIRDRTDDLEVITAVARSVAPRPETSGAVRLVGVSLSGLSDTRQDVLFPELLVEDARVGASVTGSAPVRGPVAGAGRWRMTQDVRHVDHGHGWVQGTGHGVVTVRFETRATGPGPVRTLPVDDPGLAEADPLASLAWEDWLAENPEPEDDA